MLSVISEPYFIGEQAALDRLEVIVWQQPDADQHKRFIKTARQLECDEDKERFEAKLKRIAKAKRPGLKGAQ